MDAMPVRRFYAQLLNVERQDAARSRHLHPARIPASSGGTALQSETAFSCQPDAVLLQGLYDDVKPGLIRRNASRECQVRIRRGGRSRSGRSAQGQFLLLPRHRSVGHT